MNTLTPRTSEAAVKNRYSAAAATAEPALCCPIEYNPNLLKVIPQEVIDKDYGCGDPSQYLKAGETVLDLGSGTGKICFIAAQIVGAGGRVIGVDMTDDMLEVARRNAPIVAERLGYSNVEFRKGRIQDLTLDLDKLDTALADRPISTATSYLAATELASELRLTHPLVATESVDVVVSNCVLNLVEQHDKRQLFQEIHRVLRNGGRAVISDIVSDEDVPPAMQQDPTLWSGCISGALREDSFLRLFEDSGFHGIRLLKRDATPWQTVQGIEFRSVTVEAFKASQRGGVEHNQAVVYRGPFREVLDDAGHRIRRGDRTAVCDKTFQLFRQAPYAEHFELIEPRVPVQPQEAKPFNAMHATIRHPRETKGPETTASTAASQCCAGSTESCC
ncbi:MAG: methyltransferase domain-containing protein [Verrucomicrobia bacterium]|nr:methyltransferase domain-containing protein [Verrucomicrobiota bacterium]